MRDCSGFLQIRSHIRALFLAIYKTGAGLATKQTKRTFCNCIARYVHILILNYFIALHYGSMQLIKLHTYVRVYTCTFSIGIAACIHWIRRDIPSYLAIPAYLACHSCIKNNSCMHTISLHTQFTYVASTPYLAIIIMLNKNSLGLLKKGGAKQSRIKSIAWQLRWLIKRSAHFGGNVYQIE